MISVVIPAYNEEAAVGAQVAETRLALETAGIGGVEIIVVDDGSTDRTAEVAGAAGARVIRKPQNIGYGHSLKVGIEAARFDTIVITDADGTYPSERIPALLERFRQGFDMVVGARTGAHYRESWLKAPLRSILKRLVEFTAGRVIPDINSGLRVFSRTTIMPFFPHLSDTFSFTTSATLAYMLRRKYVDYMPIDYHKRVGVTKVRLFRDSLRTLQYIVQAIVYYNPLKMFLILVLALAAGGLLALAAGMAGIAGAASIGFQAMIAAVIVFAIGLMAELLRQIQSGPDE